MEMERIHKKLDNIDQHEMRLIMLEERLHQNVRTIERAFNEIETMKSTVDSLDKSYAINNAKTKNIERIIWMFVSGLFAIAGYTLDRV